MNKIFFSANIMANVPQKYVPKHLTKKDKKRAKRELLLSRKRYKNKRYYTRKKVKSFKSKKSSHILNAERIYNIKNASPTKEFAKKTGCSLRGLKDIVKKGQGAYFSSGSRPNQTGHSWGIARLASAVTGGKSAVVDYHILKKECKKTSKALKLANNARRKYKTLRVRNKVKLK